MSRSNGTVARTGLVLEKRLSSVWVGRNLGCAGAAPGAEYSFAIGDEGVGKEKGGAGSSTHVERGCGEDSQACCRAVVGGWQAVPKMMQVGRYLPGFYLVQASSMSAGGHKWNRKSGSELHAALLLRKRGMIVTS